MAPEDQDQEAVASTGWILSFYKGCLWLFLSSVKLI